MHIVDVMPVIPFIRKRSFHDVLDLLYVPKGP